MHSWSLWKCGLKLSQTPRLGGSTSRARNIQKHLLKWYEEWDNVYIYIYYIYIYRCISFHRSCCERCSLATGRPDHQSINTSCSFFTGLYSWMALLEGRWLELDGSRRTTLASDGSHAVFDTDLTWTFLLANNCRKHLVETASATAVDTTCPFSRTQGCESHS